MTETPAENREHDRIRPLEALRALRALTKNPDDTAQVIRFVGAVAGEQLGGGLDEADPNNLTRLRTRSFGLSSAGDVNNDGNDDLLIGAMLADPDHKTNAGEAYLIFGGGGVDGN